LSSFNLFKICVYIFFVKQDLSETQALNLLDNTTSNHAEE